MEHPFAVVIFLLGVLVSLSQQSKVAEDEVHVLQQMAQTIGAKHWKFNQESCQVELFGVTSHSQLDAQSNIHCDCHFENDTCHVVNITLKGYNLPGVLPPELVKLPYLQNIDFAYNYLSGGIPAEWASLHLKSISLLANRLSGEMPKVLGNITTLTFLNLEANRFTGRIPAELGKMVNLETLKLSSNQLTGMLPMALARLKKLKDFRISDNNFEGEIPGYIQNWSQLNRLDMDASGLGGPIPPGISLLDKLTELRIADISGTTQDCPVLSNMTGLLRLVLRNCNIAGHLPAYIFRMSNLFLLDVTFNKLVGEVPDDGSADNLKFIFLTGNMLSGNVPDSMLLGGRNIDLSYNNFTFQGPGQPACRGNLNFDINLYRSSTAGASLDSLLPCLKGFSCPRYSCSLHLNCGGDDVIVKDDHEKILYEGDVTVRGGVATYFRQSERYWGFSSTGDFMDDNDYQNIRYTKSLPGNNLSALYATARISPVSLTYFAYCLENGNYSVKLHFAEIEFTNEDTYSSLGRRFFDIYIQDKLVQKDFNIEDQAHGAQKALVKEFSTMVTNNILEIRLQWAGKGTTRIPTRGVYGPLVSAISINPNSRRCTSRRNHTSLSIGIGVGCTSFVLLIMFIIWKRGCFRGHFGQEDHEELQLQGGGYTLKQIKAATNNFDPSKKLGEGGFGPVYKGVLPNGTLIAVKQLSSKSKQGNREFVNEIGMISCLQHPNLVKLHGFCVEGDQLLLVYEYMENNNLALALFGSKQAQQSQNILDWQTRVNICLGIARGLAFLHEDSRLKIVHRDIKATNVLLDKDLNPKISDFGLARLGEDEKSQISTRVAGTIGYMAPEYAIWGHLSYKVDVYSFGVVILEIISGRSNHNYVPTGECFSLLDWACNLQQSGNYMELVDPRLGSDFDIEEAEKLVKVALLCTNASPSERPTMSEVLSMFDGQMDVPDVTPDAGTYTSDIRFKSMRNNQKLRMQKSCTGSSNLTAMQTNTMSSFMSN